MKDEVPLFFLSKCLYGGWRIFTGHLVHALQVAGLNPQIYKIGNKTEKKQRSFRYGHHYRNVSVDKALEISKRGPGLIVAFDKNTDDLFIEMHGNGQLHAIMHDEDEFSTIKLREYLTPLIESGERVITVRPNSLSKMGAKPILHPYYMPPEMFDGVDDADYIKLKLKDPATKFAVSTARVDNDKRTEYIFEANRRLPKDKQIEINGFDGRVYGRKFLSLHYPEYVPSAYTFGHDSLFNGAKICAGARFNVDMSRITGDGGGGGSQYSFLEAMHAGTPVVIHEDWLRPYGEMEHGVNCYAIRDEDHLAEVLLKATSTPKGIKNYISVVQESRRLLKIKHGPKKVGNQYRKALGL